MSSQQQYCLKWNNHQTNLQRVFARLLRNEIFTDVTLACEGHALQAHKVSHPCPRPRLCVTHLSGRPAVDAAHRRRAAGRVGAKRPPAVWNVPEIACSSLVLGRVLCRAVCFIC